MATRRPILPQQDPHRAMGSDSRRRIRPHPPLLFLRCNGRSSQSGIYEKCSPSTQRGGLYLTHCQSIASVAAQKRGGMKRVDEVLEKDRMFRILISPKGHCSRSMSPEPGTSILPASRKGSQNRSTMAVGSPLSGRQFYNKLETQDIMIASTSGAKVSSMFRYS